jgi:hypothetical protein
MYLFTKLDWLSANWLISLREKYCWLVADKPSEQGGKESATSF